MYTRGPHLSTGKIRALTMPDWLTLPGPTGTLAGHFDGRHRVPDQNQQICSGHNDETHLPTKQPAPQAYARLSCPHGEQERPRDFESPAAQGPGQALSVTRATRSQRRFRIPSSGRLRHAADFQAVFDRAARVGDALFTVLARPNDAGRPRLGLAVSVKSAGNAVRRNRIKRAARESFRLIQHELGNIDLVVLARRGIDTRDGARMRSSLARLYKNVNKKCKRS